MAEKQLKITLTAHMIDGPSIELASSARRTTVYEALADALRLGVREPLAALPGAVAHVTIIYPIHRVDHFSVTEVEVAPVAAADAPEGSER